MANKRAESRPFRSGPQISVQSDGAKPAKLSRNWKDFDRMANHPTIRLAMDVTLAMAMREPWTIEGDDPEVTGFMQRQLDTYKEDILSSSIVGFFKRGWRAFETRYGFTEDDALGLRQTLDGVRSLRNEYTFRVIDPDTGDFLGVLTKAVGGSLGGKDDILIDAQHVLFVNNDDEGFGEYGEATFEVAHRSHKKWENCDDGAERYDKKVAGGVVVVKYPVGSTKYKQNNNEETDNADIAEDILKRLEASGTVKIPVRVVDETTGEVLKELNDPWKLEHVVAAGGLQPSFIPRLKYLDGQMMRAFGLPERSATEGTLGTKAEAEAHADIALLVNHRRHRKIGKAVNLDIVQPLNDNNWGDPGATQLVVGELDRDSRELFTQIFVAMLADPVHADAVAQRVDVEAMLRKLDIPTRDDQGGSFGSEVDAQSAGVSPIAIVG